CVALTVVPSEYKRRQLLENTPWMSDLSITVIPNGIDLNRFRPDADRGARARAELGLAASAFVVGYFGQIERRKRVEVLVRAAEMLRGRGRDAALLIVGAGPEDATLRRQTAALAVPAIFTGFRTDVPDLMNACDVVVHPSIGESFGFAVAEAMGCGRPVAAAGACSLPELIEDGETGFLFEPESADALAQILQLLQDDPALRRRIGTAARRAAEARFSLPTMLDRWEGALREVAESRSRAP
ncbi:MAG: glycosyltransferase family 4 protein, partial [Gemmatimonadetes bacterium]|nr:glycosyltransferase family 4 protein [Gemmatimonadota bacterium]